MLDSYGDAHRLFLQELIEHSVLTQDESIKRASRAAVQVGYEGDTMSPEDFVQFVSTINDKLKELQMQVSSVRSQATSETHWALVNQVDDMAAQLATELDKSSIEYFNLLIDAIMDADGTLSKSEVVLVARDVKAAKNSNAEVEECIDQWMREGWLEWAGGMSRVTLGPRALLELDTYIKSRSGDDDDLPSCPVCSQLALVGTRCGECHTKLCQPCLSTLLSKAQEGHRNLRCPKCKKDWDGVEDDEDNDGGAGSAGKAAAADDDGVDENGAGPATATSSAAPGPSTEADGDGEGDGEGEPAAKASGRGSRRRSARSGTRSSTR